MKNMKKNPKQNRESSLMRSPLILGLSIAYAYRLPIRMQSQVT